MYPSVPSPSDAGRPDVAFVALPALRTESRAKPRRPFVAAAAIVGKCLGRDGREGGKDERGKRREM